MESESPGEKLLAAFEAKKADILQRLSGFAISNIQRQSGGKLNPVKIEGKDSVQVVVPFSMLDPKGENAKKTEQQTHAFRDTHLKLQDKSTVEVILAKEQA